MPRMTGDRFLALLGEAEQHRDALTNLRALIIDFCRTHRYSYTQLTELLQIVQTDHELPPAEILFRERAHFETHGNKNHGEKLRMRRKRQMQKQEHYDTLRDHGGQGLIDDTDLTDEQLATILREKGLMPVAPTHVPLPPVRPAPTPAPIAAGLPGSDALNAANARTQAYDGTVDIFNNTAQKDSNNV